MHGYYTFQSPVTDPGPYAGLYDILPDSPNELIGTIRGLLIHKLVAEVYKVSLSPIQRSEQHMQTITQILTRINNLDPAPLASSREPQDRLVGMCRDFAVVFTSMLRHKRIPIRMHVGFASYIDPEGVMKYEHWITEYWHDLLERWILADPQIDGIQHKSFKIDMDIADLRHDGYFYAYSPSASVGNRPPAQSQKLTASCQGALARASFKVCGILYLILSLDLKNFAIMGQI
jgi:excinuclease ABC subunit A